MEGAVAVPLAPRRYIRHTAGSNFYVTVTVTLHNKHTRIMLDPAVYFGHIDAVED